MQGPKPSNKTLSAYPNIHDNTISPTKHSTKQTKHSTDIQSSKTKPALSLITNLQHTHARTHAHTHTHTLSLISIEIRTIGNRDCFSADELPYDCKYLKENLISKHPACRCVIQLQRLADADLQVPLVVMVIQRDPSATNTQSEVGIMNLNYLQLGCWLYDQITAASLQVAHRNAGLEVAGDLSIRLLLLSELIHLVWCHSNHNDRDRLFVVVVVVFLFILFYFLHFTHLIDESLVVS